MTRPTRAPMLIAGGVAVVIVASVTAVALTGGHHGNAAAPSTTKSTPRVDDDHREAATRRTHRAAHGPARPDLGIAAPARALDQDRQRAGGKTDQGVVTTIGRIFSYSGGAAYAIASIRTAPVTLVDETRAGSGMFRDHSRSAPHSGDAIVFTARHEITGRWTRPDRSHVAQFVDRAGAPVRLTRGQTWVELAPTGIPVTVS